MAIIVSKTIEVCVFRLVNGRHEYLMLKRSSDEKIYPNLWQFVSGSVIDGEKALDAALRELKEETGFAPERFWTVPYVNSFYDPAHDAVNVSPVFAAQVETGKPPTLSSEHSAFEWLSFADAQQRLVWPGQRLGLDLIEKYIIGREEAGILTEMAL